jgi:hypothetical protein
MSDPIPNPWRGHLKGFYQTSGLNLRAGAAPGHGGGGAAELFYRPDKSRYSVGMDLVYAFALARSRQPYSGSFAPVWRNDELHQVLTGLSLMAYPMDSLSLGFALRGGLGHSQTRYESPFPNASDHPIRDGFSGELALRASLAIFSSFLTAEAGAATYVGPIGQDAALFVRLGAGLSR